MPTTKKKTTAAAAKRTPKKSEGTRRFGIDTSFFKDIYQSDMPRFVIGIALLQTDELVLVGAGKERRDLVCRCRRPSH